MKPPETLTATVNCRECGQPFTINVPIEIRQLAGTDWQLAFDGDSLRQAVRVHALQHD